MSGAIHPDYSTTNRLVWDKYANQWQQVGAPLRPCEEDGQLMLSLVILPANNARILLLGVTPELVQLAWPADACLEACDQSAEMIASLWRPHPCIVSAVQQNRWQSMCLPMQSVDVVIGDGATTTLADKQDYHQVFTELSRVLKPEGQIVMRCFVRPDIPEGLEEILTAALTAKIKNFGALKWRLAMALIPDNDFRIKVGDIFNKFNELFPDRDRLAKMAGWSRQMVDTIDAYQHQADGYTFPTLQQLIEICEPFFCLQEVRYAHYELAQRCPTLCFVKKFAE
jgi:SAM-dependent methyltransferase